MRKKLLFGLVMVMFILTATVSSSQTQFYKWTDANDIDHYSNIAPCEGAFEKVSLDRCGQYGMAASTRSGIPQAILSEIKKTATSKFPGDYSKQEAYVKEQVESYKRLQIL